MTARGRDSGPTALCFREYWRSAIPTGSRRIRVAPCAQLKDEHNEKRELEEEKLKEGKDAGQYKQRF
jgi:hypothetical protein